MLSSTKEAAELAEEMLVLVTGQIQARAIYVATKLRIADALVPGPQTAESLAAKVGADATNLYRLLRMLTMRGIFTLTEKGEFALTPKADLLRHNTPYSLAKLTLMANEICYEAIANLEYSVKTGEAAFDTVHEMPFFDYLSHNREKERLFGEAMTDYGSKIHAGLLDAYNFGAVRSICDVGGSYGVLLSRILEKYPHIKAALFDLPPVIEAAKEHLTSELSERIIPIAGSFFEEIPPGYDLYILASIIHDWPDEQAVTILKTVRAAMPKQGRLLVLDMVMKPAGVHVDFAKMMDVTMMALFNGRERTEEEFRDLFALADLKLVRVLPTASPGSILEVVPAS